MNKYFQIMGVAVAILAAWLLRLPTVLVAPGRWRSVAISPVLIAIWHLSDPA